MTRTEQIILAPATVYALSATRQIALPAPPAGYINNILSVSHGMEFVSAAYTGATKLIYESKSGVNIFEDSAMLPAVADAQAGTLKSQATQGIFGTTEALYVTADAVAAAGDSTINGYITYEQVQIGA